jgi:hypothetical protein
VTPDGNNRHLITTTTTIKVVIGHPEEETQTTEDLEAATTTPQTTANTHHPNKAAADSNEASVHVLNNPTDTKIETNSPATADRHTTTDHHITVHRALIDRPTTTATDIIIRIILEAAATLSTTPNRRLPLLIANDQLLNRRSKRPLLLSVLPVVLLKLENGSNL